MNDEEIGWDDEGSYEVCIFTIRDWVDVVLHADLSLKELTTTYSGLDSSHVADIVVLRTLPSSHCTISLNPLLEEYPSVKPGDAGRNCKVLMLINRWLFSEESWDVEEASSEDSKPKATFNVSSDDKSNVTQGSQEEKNDRNTSQANSIQSQGEITKTKESDPEESTTLEVKHQREMTGGIKTEAKPLSDTKGIWLLHGYHVNAATEEYYGICRANILIKR